MAQATLIDAFLPHPTNRAAALTRSTLFVVCGVLLLWAAAKIQVPFWPVPMTLQTLALLGIAAAMGLRLGVATVLAYLAVGAMGAPVFAGTPEKGIGLAYMLGGTGGYLVGYILAAALVGWLAERGWDRRLVTAVPMTLAGAALVYVPGLLWLGALFGWDKPILEWGLYPFIAGDLLKAALVGCGVALGWRVARRLRAE